MRLFLLAAAVLFALAGLVSSGLGISLVISGLAWASWGLFALALDFLFGAVIPVSAPPRQPRA